MATKWHYARNGEQFGPVLFDQMKADASSGLLQADDLVWCEGMPGWEPAARIGGLFPSLATEWFFAKGEKRFGPVSEHDLKQLAIAGQIQPSDLVWCEGEPEWKTADQFPNIFTVSVAGGDGSQPKGFLDRAKEYATSDDAKELLSKTKRNLREVKQKIIDSERTKEAVDFASTLPDKWRQNSVVLGIPMKDWGYIVSLLAAVIVLILIRGMPPGYLAVYAICSLWVYRDAHERLNSPVRWSIGTLILGPLVMPAYIAIRNLKKDETREGGRAWNVLKCFALFWTITMAIVVFVAIERTSEVASRASADYEKAGVAIGSVIGFGMVATIWFFVMVSALVLGFFLKKATTIERGPTGALLTNPPCPPLDKRIFICVGIVVLLLISLLSTMNESQPNAKHDLSTPREGQEQKVTSHVREPIQVEVGDERVTRLASFYSKSVNSKALTSQISWDHEKTIEFSQPHEHGKIMLLPNNTFGYSADEFPFRVNDIATNKEITAVGGLPFSDYDVLHKDNFNYILWCSGRDLKDRDKLFAWNCSERKIQAILQMDPPKSRATGVDAPVPPEFRNKLQVVRLGPHVYSYDARYSPDQRFIATAPITSDSKNIPHLQIWDSTTLKVVHETEGKAPLAFSSDSSKLAFRNVNGPGCVLWDFTAGKQFVLRRADNRREDDGLKTLACVNGTSLLAVVTQYSDHLIELWDAQTTKLISVLESRSAGTRQSIFALASSHDGRFLVSGGKELRVWDLASGGRAANLTCSKGWVESISISLDDRRIAVATTDKKVTFFTRRSDLSGQFIFDQRIHHYSGDPVVESVLGPSGEKVRVGGDGPNSKDYFHYYVDKNGNRILHGDSRSGVNGTGYDFSNYHLGVLVKRSRYDLKDRLEATYETLGNDLYKKDEYRKLFQGPTFHLKSVVKITKTSNGSIEKEVEKRAIVSDDAPLPFVLGRPLKVNIDTAGIENMAWVKKHNASLSSVRCVSTKDQIVIDFDIDSSQWAPVYQTFPLLIRLFDENGNYLTHFTSAEGLTVFFEVYEQSQTSYYTLLKGGYGAEASKYKCVLLTPKGNRLTYSVNIRDLRDASRVEIGFMTRR